MALSEEQRVKADALREIGLRFREPAWLPTKAKGFTDLETVSLFGLTLLVFRTIHGWGYVVRSGGTTVESGAAATIDLAKELAYRHVTDQILDQLY